MMPPRPEWWLMYGPLGFFLFLGGHTRAVLCRLSSMHQQLNLWSNPEIQGLSSGSLVEKVGLYANDSVLYLSVFGPSLLSALHTTEQFGMFSSLKINWDKSPFPHALSQSQLIQIHRHSFLSIPIYVTLNVKPLISLPKNKNQPWARLPLGVMGRLGLVKRYLLPKILCVLWHFPVYSIFLLDILTLWILYCNLLYGVLVDTNCHGKL